MTFREWGLAILVGALMGYWFWPAKQSPRPTPLSPKLIEAQPAPPNPQPAPSPVEMRPALIPKAVTNARPAELAPSAPTPKPPPPGHVEFVVKEGVAIAQEDMILGKLDDGQASVQKGLTIPSRPRLWDGNVIAYSIQDGVTNRDAISSAIQQFHTQTNVRFVPYSGQRDSLVFVKSEDLCASYVGRSGGAQPIYLAPRCGAYEVRHELMHALGFVHEQSRPDRDKYIEVIWSNIDPQHWMQFWIMPDDFVHEYVGSVFNFDPQSMMLYDSTAFAKQPGLVTLRSKTGQDLRPARSTFSPIDRERLFYLYGR